MMRSRSRLDIDRLRSILASRVRIDTRSLAVFRIVLGLLLVADVVLRARTFPAMYTEAGAVPRELAIAVGPEYALSIFHLTTDPTIHGALFVAGGLVGLALTLGYYTRAMTVAAFVFAVSLDFHNPLVLSYADWLYRLLLFWAIFLPLGERFSIDAVHRERPALSGVAGLAAAMVLVQVVFVYSMNALLKAQSTAWPSGEAAVLVFGLDEVTFLLGDVARRVPLALELGGTIWFALLLGAPILLVVRGRLRFAYIVALALGHLAFAVTVRIGAFPYVSIAGLTVFVQGVVWRDGTRVSNRWGIAPTIKAVRRRCVVIGERIPRPRLTSDSTTQMIDRVRSGALVVVVASFVVFALVLAPHAGLLTSPDHEAEERYEAIIERSTVASTIEHVHASIGIAQPSWNIFAPEPRSTDRYYVVAVQTADGNWHDIYNDRPLSFDRPGDQLQRQHETYRDRFYMNRLSQRASYPNAAEAYARHICTVAEEHLDASPVSVSIVRVTESVTVETIDTPDERERSAQRVLDKGCGDHDAESVTLPDWAG